MMKAKCLPDTFGRTLVAAVQSYLEHLKMQNARASGSLVSDLAAEWYYSQAKVNMLLTFALQLFPDLVTGVGKAPGRKVNLIQWGQFERSDSGAIRQQQRLPRGPQFSSRGIKRIPGGEASEVERLLICLNPNTSV